MPLMLKKFVAVIMILTMTGCAAGPTEFLNRIQYEDKDDVCYAQRVEMNQNGKLFDQDILLATALGGLTGAAAALATGNDPLVGALIGAGLGLAGGYLAKHIRDGRSGREISNATAADVRKRNKDIDKLLKSYDKVVDCRKQTAKAINLKLKLKEISKDEATSQMAEVRTRYREDVNRFKEIAKQVSENSAEYTAVYNEIAASNGRRGLEVSEYSAKKKRSYKSKKVESKTKDKKVADKLKAPKKDTDKLKKECETNIEKRDDCFERIEESDEVEETFTLTA